MGRKEKEIALPRNDALKFVKQLNRAMSDVFDKVIHEVAQEAGIETEFDKLDAPENLRERLMLVHEGLVKPHVPWKEIGDCLPNFDNNDIELAVFILKPLPIEELVCSDKPNPMGIIQGKVCGNINKSFKEKIKKISPIIKHLEGMQKDDFPVPIKQRWGQAIKELKYIRDFYRETVQIIKDSDREWRRFMGVDINIDKSPQKHPIWNSLIVSAIEIVNPYYHTDDCDRNCKQVHKSAVDKVAQLLKILYPDIWIEDISTISKRINQKYYRNF